MVERIVEKAHLLLARHGWLVLEVGADQEGEVERLFANAGVWGNPEWVRDLAGIRRVVSTPLGKDSDEPL